MRASPPEVAVVVLNWNGWADTEPCLASLRDAGYPHLHVILVDNGSTDGSPGKVRAAFPEVEVLETGANLGFAGGNNRGLERALARGSDYAMLLNNDTLVEPGFVEPLLDALRGGADVASPAIEYADDPGRLWFGGGELDPPRHADIDRVDGVVATPWVTGCCLVASREIWERVGLLDARYFLIHEDVEWSLRASAAGYRAVVVGPSRIRHKVSSTLGEQPLLGLFYYVRNGLLLAREHGGPGAVRRFLGDEVVRPTLREVKRRDPRTRRAAAARFRGVSAFARGRYGAASR